MGRETSSSCNIVYFIANIPLIMQLPMPLLHHQHKAGPQLAYLFPSKFSGLSSVGISEYLNELSLRRMAALFAPDITSTLPVLGLRYRIGRTRHDSGASGSCGPDGIWEFQKLIITIREYLVSCVELGNIFVGFNRTRKYLVLCGVSGG